jgi:hypothetical protein
MMPGERGLADSGAAGTPFRLEIDRIKVTERRLCTCGSLEAHSGYQ